jgi:hypothetical protein
MEKAILIGPFIGEMYWECGRFAPMLPYFKFKQYRKEKIKYVVLTRPDRFDMYGKFADILVPLKINGDYKFLQPNCFRLNNYPIKEYNNIVNNFYKKYAERFKILQHIYPDINKGKFCNKDQFPRNKMLYKYSPRDENYELLNSLLPKDKKRLVLLAPRFRKGFRRNWPGWSKFYDLVYNDEELNKNFNFVICGKEDEYVPDEKNRFLDMVKIEVSNSSSRIGLLLGLMEKASLTVGSQSAIPNISLLYNVEVLEFGCQKSLHTVTYNVKQTPITFIENRNYDIKSKVLFSQMKEILKKY